MPKRKEPPLNQPEQSERFRRAIRELEDAGELNPTEGDALFDRAITKILPTKQRER